jgi:hypothetical protein
MEGRRLRERLPDAVKDAVCEKRAALWPRQPRHATAAPEWPVRLFVRFKKRKSTMLFTTLWTPLASLSLARNTPARSINGQTRANPWPCSRRLVAALLLPILAAGAAAQSHEVERGGVVLRSSTVASDRISPEAAKQHGVNQSPDRAILNVVVLTSQPGSPATLPALVSASTRSLAGERTVIEMREVRANDRVSYIGTYVFAPREVLDFEVTAQPTGGASQEPLTLKYQERMWAR